MLELRKKTRSGLLVLTTILGFAFAANAQMFEGQQDSVKTTPSVVRTAPKTQPVINNRDILANPRARKATVSPVAVKSIPTGAAKPKMTTYAGEKVTQDEVVETEKRLEEQPKKKRYIPQVMRPTLDGVKRGRTSMRQVVKDGEQPVDDPMIFLYYTDFSVDKTLSGTIMCSVRFMILTTLNSRLTNLSARLKWPGMETTISFNSVNPNEETYFDYTLLGEGCYSMDKIPNIVVNRCRVKNMTQQECASKIRWLKK